MQRRAVLRTALLILCLSGIGWGPRSQEQVSGDWKTFWPAFQKAVVKRDQAALKRLMSPEFLYDYGRKGEAGDARENAFRHWHRPKVNGWSVLAAVVAQGTVASKPYTEQYNRPVRIAPPAANMDNYYLWRALFVQRKDHTWKCVAFVKGD